MRKRIPTTQRSVQHELTAIATVLRQINASLKELIAVDEEAEEREKAYRALTTSAPYQAYLAGRWKNQDGTTYHPLDEKAGSLEQEQRDYQRTLIDGKKTDNS